MGVRDVSVSKSSFVSVRLPGIKRSSKFTCLGWIRRPIMADQGSLVLMAIADLDDAVDSDRAFKIELMKDGPDYRLLFSNSISGRIANRTYIDLNDEEWHFLAYVCSGEGSMHYYVDGTAVSSKLGTGPTGVDYSVAWSRRGRLGGGPVWVPYITNAGQSVTSYNWRFANGLILHQGWIQELMNEDLAVLQPGN